MNLTNSAKNHFLNFFNGFFEQKEDGIENYCRAEYGKDWEYAYNCYKNDGKFPNYMRKIA